MTRTTDLAGVQERYAHSLMNTFGPPKRLLVRGEGVYVWDHTGQRYLDLLAGIAVNALGHAHPAVVDAVGRQLATLGHISNLFASGPQLDLAERLLALAGLDDGRVFFANSGAEANECALKATRRTGRGTIVAAVGSFHGRTLGALSITHKPAFREPFEPLPDNVRFVPYGDVAALTAAVDDDTAAVVLEPIQGEAGVVVPPDGYLRAAREVCDRSGALLWLDEVQTGIGRTGGWFAFQTAADPVRPDLITLAKGLGGGIPVGACLAAGSAADLLGPGSHGATFGGNPVATAAALAVLDTVESEDLLARARTVGNAMAARLADVDGVAAVRGRGLLLAAELAQADSAAVTASALEHGLIVNNVTPTALRFAPPLILTEEHVDEAVPAISAALVAAGTGERGS